MIAREWLSAFLLGVALVATGCADSDDDDASGDDVGPPLDAPTDDGAGEGPATAAAIRVDNHVELLSLAFELYVGDSYAPDIIDAVGGFGAATGRQFSEPFTHVCDNGGTAIFDGPANAIQSFSLSFEFDDCQIGATVYDGYFERISGRYGFGAIGTGFTFDDSPTLRLEFSGEAYRSSATSTMDNIDDWSMQDVDFRRVTPDGELVLQDANSTFAHGPVEVAGIHRAWLRGGFTFRSPLTEGRAIRARTLTDFDYPVDAGRTDADGDFAVGRLELSAEDGSLLVLDAATGDEDTVSVEIVADGERESVVQPWSLWHARLRFAERESARPRQR